ncbi:MAG: hypothetical protein II327_06575, partial [Lachnospiraceae bacterium]|nr:hypothetical protein [Lachnospiraceae bacterium]
KVDSLELRMDSLEHKVDSLELKMDSLEHKMDSLELRMDSLEHRMDSMEDKMNDEFFRLNLRLENEVFFGIKAVADGHADIMRKYKHLLDDRYDKEQILVRLVHHESKIHEIERNCKHCA